MLRLGWLGVVVSFWASPVVAQGPSAATACQSAASCEKDCERGVAAACTKAAGFSSADVLRALGLFQRGCDGGDGAGCAGVAEVSESGKGIKADPKRALTARSRACDLRHGPSCVSLARSLESSASSMKDLRGAGELMNRAVQLYFKGCDAGLGAACGELSRLYVWGVGMKPDLLGGAVMAQRACDKGDGASCRFLGYLYETGQGVQQDGKRASDAYRKAKEAPEREVPLRVPTLLTAQAPALVIVSEPPGATVHVDKLFAGVTPVGVTVPPGEHLVELTLRDRPDLQQRVTAAVGPAQQVRLGWPGVLKLEAAPAVATATVDQKPALKLPARLELAAGAHTVVVSASGYESQTKTVTIAAGAETTETFALKPAPGSVSITSTPPGASISVDGLVVGVTPWTGDVAPGKHQLEVSLAGHKPSKKALSVTVGTPVVETVVLEPVRAVLGITSTPQKARLLLDGAVVGLTPWSGLVASGLHTFELRLEGYEVVTDTVDIPLGAKAATRAVVLKGKAPALSVVANDGATVSLDGKVLGPSPWSGETTPGRHVLEVSLVGFKPFKKTLTLAPAGMVSETVALTRELVPLSVTSTPRKASVWLDDVRIGETPMKGVFGAGPHTLEVKLDGFQTIKEPLELSAGQKAEKNYQLAEAKPGVFVTTTPPGADVFVDDETRLGSTPWNGEVTPGAHVVMVRLAGYEMQTRSIDVKARTRTDVAFTLSVAPMLVTVETSPPGAQVAVDGVERGVAPVKVSLMAGEHRVVATLANFERQELVQRLSIGGATTWRLELKEVPQQKPADAPPAPPLVAAVDSRADQQRLRAVLADEKATKAAKQAALQAFAKEQRDVTEFIADIKPDELRGELCLEWRERVYPASLVVTAADAFKDAEPSTVLLNGTPVGSTPFDGVVPSCATRVSVQSVGSGATLDKRVPRLETQSRNTETFVYPGRMTRAVFSAFGEAAHAPYGFGLGPETHFGGGVRFDLWGKVFHLSVAVKAITLFGDVVAAPVAPAADLFLGFGTAFGSETVRFRFAFDLGAWTLVCPSARLSLSLAIKEFFFVSLTPSLHLHPRLFIPVTSRGAWAFIRESNYVFGSVSLAAGFGW